MTTTGLTPEALARTYAGRSYADPYEAVEDYRRFQRVAAEHPEAGSHVLGKKLDLPRSRVRSWASGSVPDGMTAIRIAEERDWFTGDRRSSTFRGLSRLVAWIFSGGSINDLYVPQFAVDGPASIERITDTLDAVGIEHRNQRENEQGRATEVIPTEHASVLGRALVVLGAPQGPKAEQPDLTLPEYLDDAPVRVRREFVDVYLRNRIARQDDRLAIRFREHRPQRYLDELAALIESVAGERVTVTEENIYLSTAATESLYGRLGPPL